MQKSDTNYDADEPTHKYGDRLFSDVCLARYTIKSNGVRAFGTTTNDVIKDYNIVPRSGKEEIWLFDPNDEDIEYEIRYGEDGVWFWSGKEDCEWEFLPIPVKDIEYILPEDRKQYVQEKPE